MVQNTIIKAIKNGNVTDEQILSSTKLSPMAIKTGIVELIESGIIGINDQGQYYNAVYGGNEATPIPTPKYASNTGDNMKTKAKQVTGNKKTINCTPEQREFANHVCKNKGKIFDAQEDGKVFIHRGAQVLFGGAGNQSLRYKIAVSGFSDKESVEYAIMYLDWDDTALYEEGGLADQIKEVIGATSKPKIAPAIVAMGAK